jgi:hypothetical protein
MDRSLTGNRHSQPQATKATPMTAETKPHIYLDRSGELATGYFCTIDFDEDGFPDKAGVGEILVKRTPSEEDLIRKGRPGYFSFMFETSFDLKTEVRKDCPVDRSHITQSWWKDLKVMPSDSKRIATPVVSLTGFEFAPLIRDDLLQALKKSGLTGWKTEEVIFASQDGDELGRTSKPGPYPKLWYFQFRGRGRLRSFSVRNAPNVCPFCGHGRLICPGCQWMVSRCPKCEGSPWATPQMVLLAAKEGKKVPKGTLIWEGVSQGILQGEHWDGSDFIQIGQGAGDEFGPYDGDKHIITKRALDWLLARHVMPLWAQPIPVDVSKMNKEQRKRLEAARDMKSLESKP